MTASVGSPYTQTYVLAFHAAHYGRNQTELSSRQARAAVTLVLCW